MIRPALASDVPRIVEMSLAFIASTPYAAILTPDPDSIRDTAHAFCGASDRVILLADSLTHGVIGMLALVAYTQPFTGERIAGELVWWVEPEHRGQGGRLLVMAERWAADQGAKALQMIAPNPDLEVLYERRGYRPIERTYSRRLAA